MDFKSFWTSHALGVTTEEEGKRAEQLQFAWMALEQGATSLGRTILNDLSPYIINVGNQMVAWVAANREWLESKIHEGIQAVIDKARDLYQYLSTVDWATVWKTLIEWITQAQLQFLTFFDFLKAHWPEIEKFVSDFADDIRRVAGFIDDVVRATTGWGKAAEIFFALWAFSKFAPIIGALSAIVGLIGGANTGILGLAGNFALLGLRLAPILALLSATGFAGGEDKQFSDENNKEYLDKRGA